MRVLNLGCGGDSRGDVRLDFAPSPNCTATEFCDLEKEIPKGSSEFSEIICENLIEHVRNPGHLLDEIDRVLSPNGLLHLTTDNAGWFLYSMPLRGGTLHGAYIGLNPKDRHFMIFEPDHLKNLTEASGLNPLSIDYAIIDSKTGHSLGSQMYYKSARFLGKIWPFSKRFLFPHLIMEAVKP